MAMINSTDDLPQRGDVVFGIDYDTKNDLCVVKFRNGKSLIFHVKDIPKVKKRPKVARGPLEEEPKKKSPWWWRWFG